MLLEPGNLEFNIKKAALCELRPHLSQRRNMDPGGRSRSAQLAERRIADDQTRNGGIMKHSRVPVDRQSHVEFKPVAAMLQRDLE